MELNNKSILITGGTGSLGRAITDHLIKTKKKLKKLIILSRDEQKQFLMSKIYSEEKYPFIRYFIGDVRDKDRLKRAFKNVDYVIHAAAMKHVPIAEYNPDECIKTNVNGAQNVISASLDSGVKKVIAISTDKACSPVNLYGATKLTSDKLFIAANNFKGRSSISFSVVRYGNVMGSKGSVIPFFMKMKKNGLIPITDPKMTRFNITLKESIEIIFYAIENSLGGELFVPKIPSYNIMELAEAIAPNIKKEIIGVRPGEKIHEEMISTSDSDFTYDIGKYYITLPNSKYIKPEIYSEKYNLKKVRKGFSYNSGENKDFLSVEELRDLIKSHV
ncbi:MAG: UDP-N-acetylglucosamine 4,6-dehydratase (inverting) [Flavobacteriaceae bacterium]|jgi:UDP-N-acetylglucosamine 4,6-dehydratase/5-epimerase|nr:UDP-N-acetylglucosamine 4,6-dehydratase (inverting) [Flavobacteriaceae bacterium]